MKGKSLTYLHMEEEELDDMIETLREKYLRLAGYDEHRLDEVIRLAKEILQRRGTQVKECLSDFTWG